PRLAVLAAAADVGEREHAARLDPRDPRCREAWGQRNVEPAIAVEQRRCRRAHVLAADDEYRNPRPVLGGIEPLLDRDGLGVEHQLPLRELRRLARRDVQPIDRRGAIEAGEAVERLRVPGLAGEPADAADPAELHRRELAALEV